MHRHQIQLKAVIKSIHEAGLKLKPSKCEFGVESTTFLGYVVDRDGIHMEEGKVCNVVQWPTPKNGVELARFLGLAGFYRRFITNFAAISAPLYELVNLKSTAFHTAWSDAESDAFLALKTALGADPVVVSPEPNNFEFQVYVDASQYALGATLRQLQGSPRQDRTIAFYSKKLSDPETRYSAYDRELLGVKEAVQHWHHYLAGSKFTVFCDHRTIHHNLKQHSLTPRQMWYLEPLIQYDFEIEYITGAKNYVQDALSCRPDYKEPPVVRNR